MGNGRTIEDVRKRSIGADPWIRNRYHFQPNFAGITLKDFTKL